ncbi:MAG: biopolymer transporter ExbD [Anaeromyxobacter sp.]|nr:biopolymer transporter ExbD [Anaeromyxobacter sp.]
MALGGPSGEEADGEGGLFADINITPLTDIFLVLLIIFMVTTTAIAEQAVEKGGFKVSLPRTGKGDAGAPRDLSVAILADGRVVSGGKVVDEAELRALLTEAHARSADTVLLVQADEGVAHGKVVGVMNLARTLGLTRLAIATRAEAER